MVDLDQSSPHYSHIERSFSIPEFESFGGFTLSTSAYLFLLFVVLLSPPFSLEDGG